ncbi:MAG: nitroreductase family protein [Bacteroidales bacterium]|nr:nitroreductase family protein [Candidatus Cryptobacteroides aphodequi]
MKQFIFLTFAALLCISGCNSNPKTMNKDFLQLATDRYSVRSFDATPVDQAAIDKILRAGQVAPTAINSQPQKIYVVRTPEAIAKLNTLSPCLYGAPQCFVFCYDDTKVAARGEGDNYGDIDVTIVLTHMMLEAANLGIGTCAVGYFDREKLIAELELPVNIHPILLMPLGYAAADAKPSDRHSSYRPLEETVEYR